MVLCGDAESSDSNDIESSFFIPQNTAGSRSKPRGETEDLTDHRTETSAMNEFKFPYRQFGKKKIVKRSFQSQWFKKWGWLPCNETQDLAFCHMCATARETGKMIKTGNADLASTECGFSNWKDASGQRERRFLR